MVQQRPCWSAHHTVFGAFVHLPTLHRDFLTSPQNSPPHTHHPHVVLHKRGQEPSLLLTASPRGWQLGWLVCTAQEKKLCPTCYFTSPQLIPCHGKVPLSATGVASYTMTLKTPEGKSQASASLCDPPHLGQVPRKCPVLNYVELRLLGYIQKCFLES